jgi:hypothetical protein
MAWKRDTPPKQKPGHDKDPLTTRREDRSNGLVIALEEPSAPARRGYLKLAM